MRRSLLRTAAILALLTGPASAQEAAEPPTNPAATAAAGAAPGAITLELNKLVQVENACHAYVVIDNQTSGPLKELTVDAYLFDKAGVILRGLALPFTDVRSGRATVMPFVLPDLPCADVSRILLNKVLTCTSGDGAAVEGCADMLAVSTRAETAFEY
jgi:hypothetical protein